MELLENRLHTRRGDASDADSQVLRRAKNRQNDDISWTVVDATDADAALMRVQAILAALATPRHLPGGTGATQGA